jgi:tetratricopeptide (TPR) repeat protein
MPPTHLCIVARPMRTAMRIVTVAMLVTSLFGCEQLDGRNRNRKGNNLFREMRFADAAGEYEKALKEVDDPTIHYNLALAYSKVFKPGYEGTVDVELKGTPACDNIPGTKTVNKQVCVKPGSTLFTPCDEKNVCASSFTCQKVDICTLDDGQLADLAAQHYAAWLKSHPSDAETRGLMTQVWIDASQYKKAIDFWEGMLQQKPNDPEIMGALAGINLKANDWRKSIEWYLKVAEVSKDPTAKAAAYQFIGNVAWSKLNSKTLTAAESVELADRGIGALQKEAELMPNSPKPVGLEASIFNFRALAMGASWAAALDRATAQDRQRASRVLTDEAKKAQGSDASAPAPAGSAATPTPSPAQGSATGG